MNGSLTPGDSVTVPFDGQIVDGRLVRLVARRKAVGSACLVEIPIGHGRSWFQWFPAHQVEGCAASSSEGAEP